MRRRAGNAAGAAASILLLTLALAERTVLAQQLAHLFDIGALAGEIVADRPAKAGMRDIMGGMRRHRQVTAGELVFALRSGLDPFQPFRKGEVDRLVIADLEMQEGMILDAAPVTAVERIAADEVDRAGDIAP